VQNTAHGVYINGQVVLNDPVPKIDKSEVVVVFLDVVRPKQKLSDIFSIYGTWEDSRTADETIGFIRASRTERADICL